MVKITDGKLNFPVNQSGDYVIEVRDDAGNVMRKVITVNLPDDGGASDPGSSDNKPTPSNVPSIPVSNVILTGWFGENAPIAAAILVAIILLLLLLWFARPVRIEYSGIKQNDGQEYRKVVKRFAKVPRKQKPLKLDVFYHVSRVDMKTVTVTFMRGFTRRMRDRDVVLMLSETELNRAHIPADQQENWTQTAVIR